MSDEGLQRIAGGRNPVIIFHVHVSKPSRYKKHYLVVYSPRCTWKLELGVQVQVTVSRLQSHSSRLQRSSRPLYTLARAAATSITTTTSRDMAPRPWPHHRTITIMALTAPWLCCCVVDHNSVVDNAQYFSLFTLVAAAVAAALSAGCGLGAPRPAPPRQLRGRAGPGHSAGIVRR